MNLLLRQKSIFITHIRTFKALYILTIVTFFCSVALFAEGIIGIIKDPDGFTLVRSGQGKEFNVVDTLFADDIFDLQFINHSDWASVSIWKGKKIEGFVHKSSIQEVEKLDPKNQKLLISKILDKHRILAGHFQKVMTERDSLAIMAAIQELEYHSDTKYDPILSIIPKYVCITKDTEILDLLFATIWADRGSANEMPSFAIGSCFVCNPNLVIKQLTKIQNNEQKKILFDNIEWGLLNHFNIDNNGNPNNKEFRKFKGLLDSERNKFGL